MPICPDCLINDGKLSVMISQGTEIYEDREYIIIECIECGSSQRVRKED